MVLVFRGVRVADTISGEHEADTLFRDWRGSGSIDNPVLDYLPGGIDYGAEAMADRLLGIDVSKWQGEMDWNKAADSGAKFAFIRAGSITNLGGELYTDFQFERNAVMASEFMPVGFYWYFRPQHDPIKQAEYFYNLIFPETWLIPPVIDVENDGGLSPAEYADAVTAFLDELENYLRIRPLIYTSNSKWARVEPRPYWPDYDLWVAHYEVSEPLLPEGWSGWRYWQHSAKGNGAQFGAQSSYIDLDYFNGDEDSHNDYLGINLFDPKVIEVTTARNGYLQHEIGGVYSSIVPLGTRLSVVGVGEDDKGRLWYDVGGWWIPGWQVEVVE